MHIVLVAGVCVCVRRRERERESARERENWNVCIVELGTRKEMGVVMGFEEFQQVHAVLLASAGVPASLHRLLFEKLSADVFDGGSFFRIEPCEEDGLRQRRLILSCESMAKNSNVFLIDHAWSFRLSEARKQVRAPRKIIVIPLVTLAVAAQMKFSAAVE